MATLQQIRDALLDHLVAAGPYSRQEVSACSFDVMEGTSACAIVFLPGTDTTREEVTFGATDGQDVWTWSIAGSIFIKDTGDSALLLARVWQAHDDFKQTMATARTLGSTVNNCNVARMSFDPRSYVEAGGAEWAEIRWTLSVED